MIKVKNYFPWLAGKQQGKIPYFNICDEKGIYTLEKCQIDRFQISYFASSVMKTISVSGHVVPDSICLELGKYAIDTIVFISNIIGKIEQEEVQLNSMSFILTKKENE